MILLLLHFKWQVSHITRWFITLLLLIVFVHPTDVDSPLQGLLTFTTKTEEKQLMESSKQVHQPIRRFPVEHWGDGSSYLHGGNIKLLTIHFLVSWHCLWFLLTPTSLWSTTVWPWHRSSCCWGNITKVIRRLQTHWAACLLREARAPSPSRRSVV